MYDAKWATKNEDIPEVYAFYGDLWKYMKATYNIPETSTDVYFDYIMDVGNQLAMKYKGTKAENIAEQFVSDYITDVERRYKEMKAIG